MERPIEKIEMKWPDGWHPACELLHFIGTRVDLRILKAAYYIRMAAHLRGSVYFRFRRQGASSWQYFTVDM